jgi:hypothetical protein
MFQGLFLVRQCVLLGLILSVLNLLVGFMGGNSIPRQKLRMALNSVHVTDIFLGDSTIEAGIDLEAYRHYFPHSVPMNLGIGATSPIEHALIFSKVEPAASRRLFYGYIDTRLTDKPLADHASLVGNRAMSYYINPELAMRLMGLNTQLSRLQYQLLGSVAIYVERTRVWAKVEKVRRHLAGLGFPTSDVNRFGRVSDFQTTDASSINQAQKFKDAVSLRIPLTESVFQILEWARAQKSLAFVVEMPRPSRYRTATESEARRQYRDYLMSLVHKRGATYIDASNWIKDDRFEDAYHLNMSGAKEFTERLAHFVDTHSR